MSLFERVGGDGWVINDNGRGYWAASPDDELILWVDGDEIHLETMVGHYDVDVPLAVIDRLRELSKL